MNKKLCALFVGSLFSLSAWGQEPATDASSAGDPSFTPIVVRDIRVEGIQRTEAGTVFSYLPVKVGDTLTKEKAAAALKALFATGFFRDVRIETEGNVMVVAVEERPAIAKISFVGMKEFDKATILSALKDLGFAEAEIFDRAMLDKVEQELKRQYLARGKYAAQVKAVVTPMERNRVAIEFDITEGPTARIKSIRIVGAHAFKEKDLLDLFDQTTSGWLTWYTRRDQYSRQKLTADLEKLRSYYMNRGYMDFKVDSTPVSISPDKEHIYITINIEEGSQYQVSSVKLAGNLILDEKELRPLVLLKPGQIFSRQAVNDTTKKIADKLSERGYAFANVNASPEIDKEKKQVAFTIFVDPGKRVYVRRVNITGNTRTRDEVIRREIRQMEGGWFNANKVKLSRERVDKLGYFTAVTVETPPVKGTNDQVDVHMNVEEKPTGNIMLGAGFSQSEKVMLSGAISQDNIFGSGKHLTLGVDTSRVNRRISLSYTNPYFTMDGISQGFNFYHRRFDPSNSSSLDIGDYKTESTGGGINFGFPLSERESFGVGLGVDYTKITTYEDSPQQYIDFANDYGSSNTSFPLTLSWTRDGKNSYIFPTSGAYQRIGTEIALPGGDLKYWKLNYKYQHYTPLNKTFTFMYNLDLGIGNSYGGQNGLPFYKNYYAGGIDSVRGYADGSLGPSDSRYDDEHVGGSKKVVTNLELLWGVPGYGQAMRMGWFFDAGQVYSTRSKSNEWQNYDDSIRTSTGLSLSWISPVGPLKFSIAHPLNAKSGDDTQTFQFQLGSTF